MKNACFYTLTIFAAVLGFSTAVFAEDPITCNELNATTFEPEGAEGSWFKPGNWSYDVPDSTKIACISSDKTAIIRPYICIGGEHDGEICPFPVPCPEECGPSPLAQAGRIRINASGTVIVDGDSHPANFKLYGDSTVDGELRLFSSPTLYINGQITFDGSGDIVLLQENTNNDLPTIEGQGELTLEGACAESCSPDEWAEEYRDDNLVLSGAGVIDIALDNDAHVVATHERALTIKKQAYGNGFWIAEPGEQTAGVLDIDIDIDTVTGSGTWVVAGHSTAEIRINTACTDLTGDFLVYNGTLLLSEDFDTDGNLVMTGGTITLASGKYAMFGY